MTDHLHKVRMTHRDLYACRADYYGYRWAVQIGRSLWFIGKLKDHKP